MHPSVLLTSLAQPFEAALATVTGQGFTHVDVVALAQRPAAHLDALADSGLIVSCGAIGKGMPPGHELDSASTELRRAALDLMKQQIVDAARLGATHGYLVSGLDTSHEGSARFAEGIRVLADVAGERMVKLCVEPIPGRALPSARSMLDLLAGLDHPNLYLLLDVGHCLISDEAPAAVVREAGSRLGYVHLDDNDGQGDLHWPLLTGRLTQQVLLACFAELMKHNYQAALSLELNPQNPPEALVEGKKLIERLLSAVQGVS